MSQAVNLSQPKYIVIAVRYDYYSILNGQCHVRYINGKQNFNGSGNKLGIWSRCSRKLQLSKNHHIKAHVL